MAFVAGGRWVFVDEKRVGCEGMSDSASCDGNFLASVEEVRWVPLFCVFLD